ncbi:Hypothetical_protein [Hexamita inflata]|uniref:Hypothetical_protein n=1 Tax=Hexamita inflata TaxID=28002 RepID=A0AA86NCL0_9EUKA|nr:Hypothetical protein HINF_LOCUS4867 [Hexamita inflata]CAI9917236.1 Hypothetical protein HINF_LOCUS4881 [Hexamita inflata]
MKFVKSRFRQYKINKSKAFKKRFEKSSQRIVVEVKDVKKAMSALESQLQMKRKKFLIGAEIYRGESYNRPLFKYDKFLRYQFEFYYYNSNPQSFIIQAHEEYVDKIKIFFEQYNNPGEKVVPKLKQIKTTVISGVNTIKLIEEKLSVKREVFMHKKPSITTTKAGMEVLSFWAYNEYYERINQFINECTLKESPKHKQKKWAFKDQK